MTTTHPDHTTSTNQIHSIGVRLIDDPTRSRYGFTLNSTYVEHFWLGVLGPTSIAFLRYIARTGITPDEPGYRGFDPLHLNTILGTGHGTSRNSPLGRTINRLARFNILTIDTPDDADTVRLSIPTHLHPVAHSRRIEWPADLRAAHGRAINARISQAHPSNGRRAS